MTLLAKRKRIGVQDLAREPFRVFFPIGLLAGIFGVGLWPLYFGRVTSTYPGLFHARMMAWGFFGAFIFGFLGTAMPRMLTAPPLGLKELGFLLALHVAMLASYGTGNVFAGDICALAVVLAFTVFMAFRARKREDLPPPGFVLVGLSLACVVAGASLAIAEHYVEMDARWVAFERLVSYQGFVLFPILGIGPFLLPRFLGLPTPEFPEARKPGAAWRRKAAVAAGAGLLILASFFIEARGSFRIAYGLRFGVTLFYFLLEMPLRRGPGMSNALGLGIRIALIGIVAGFLAVALFPGYRVALLHLTLIGGFAVITFTVATRVAFGHSGNLALLKKPNRWLLVSIGVMLFAMATRVSGDFWPKILASHYIYGAILWIVAALVWAAYVLPKLLVMEDE